MLHEIYFFIFQLILVFLVMIALFAFINNVATDLGFEKRFTSIDMALLSTALFYTPGIVKHTYFPLEFKVKDSIKSVEAKFFKSEVAIKDKDNDLLTEYWFLSDLSMDEFVDRTDIGGVRKTVDVPILGKIKMVVPRAVTFYKAGRTISFSERDTNAYQLVCPVVNTTVKGWESKKVFLALVNSKRDDPASRIANVLVSQFPRFSMNSALRGSASLDLASKISGIDAGSDLVIAIGSSGETKELGGLVVYIPIDDAILKSRKLACLIINHLLTPESAVLYAQVMPVDPKKISSDSPLAVFKEKNRPDQAMVFIDMGRFSKEQVQVRNFAQALEEAVQHYYGKRSREHVSGPTVSVSYSLMSQAAGTPGAPDLFSSPSQSSSGSGATFVSQSSAPAADVKPFGKVVDGIKVNSDWGEITLDPDKICPSDLCDDKRFDAISYADNPRKQITIHTTVGTSKENVADFFKNRFKSKGSRIGTNYILGRDGRYIYFISENRIAAHAPGTVNGLRPNRNALSIEISNAENECKKICVKKYDFCPPSACQRVPPEQLATLTPQEIKFWGENNVKNGYYEVFPAVQLKSLLKLVCEMAIRYQIPAHQIFRHLDASMARGKGHNDPGPMFPFRKWHKNVVSCIQQYNEQVGALGSPGSSASPQPSGVAVQQA